MTESIIAAIITGVVTLIGVVASNSVHDAVIDTKLETLTEEVRKHNNFAEKIPAMGVQIDSLDRRVGMIEKKI